MINGVVYDFESLNLLLPTGLTLGAESVDYGDEKGDEVITGAHNIPLGIGRGEYKGTCKLEIARFEYDKLNVFAMTAGGFYNMPPIPVIANYGHLGQIPVTDSMMVHFTKRDFKGSKGDTSLNVSIEGAIVAPITSNGVPAYIPE